MDQGIDSNTSDQSRHWAARQALLSIILWYSLTGPIVVAGITALAFWFQIFDVGAVVSIASLVGVTSLIAGIVSALQAKSAGMKILVLLGWSVSSALGLIAFFFVFFSMDHQ